MMSGGASKWELFAPAIGALEPLRRRWIRRALASVDELCPLRGKLVLDVGAGTGTCLAELARYDCRLVAVEPSFSMSRVIRRRFPEVPVHEDPADAMHSLSDASVDVTVVAATLHGFGAGYRQRVYTELKRVTRQAVAIIDYRANRNPFVALAEWIEGGDYFNFVRVVDAELDAAFTGVDRREISSFESLYLSWVGPNPTPSDQ